MPMIKKPSEYFNVVTYTGNGSTQSITGVGFQPDFVWIKSRSSGALWHALFDNVRGVNKRLFSNATDAEDSTANTLTSFDADGFTLGSQGGQNTNGATFVAWCWKANGSGSSNTAGSITSTVSANTSAGFSVVTFTSPSGTGNFSVGHGLGVAPKMVIVKSRDTTGVWYVYHTSLATDYYLRLNGTNSAETNGVQWGDGMTSSVIGLRAGYSTVPSATTVAYCFSEVAGYSKFGSYTGNGSTDGPFIYTGFRPKFVMIKNSSSVTDWNILDASRNTYNVTGLTLQPDNSNAEQSGWNVDFLSNGFKIRTTLTDLNGSGNTIIYAAFAENPFKYSLAR